MSPATLTGFTRHTSQWSPPLQGAELDRVLTKIRHWTPFDGDALLDDIGAVLDDVVPSEEHSEEFARRLRGHLMQLVNIAVAAGAEEDITAAQLIRQARVLRTAEVPGDRWKAVGHLRRMGWTLSELYERLVAAKCLKEAA
ncbi:DUF6415 family natural product biosynthesis protein [Streptomyces cadmiisoli]|uniref:DUF6415 family natural product biosynthesis protein n=1 Tax=Streptomyces cadmiisoli TaxID=2184053 RepID=UPI003D724544